MTALTVDQIEYIRATTGDDCEPYDVSAGLLQKLYDRSTDDECLTIVEVLRIRVVKAAKLVNQSTAEGASQSLHQKYTALKELLKDWEIRCGVGVSAVTAGAISLGIDEEDGAV
jgi:hypothetical protein